MIASEFLRKNPTFDVQDIEFLKVKGEYDQTMLDTWHKELNGNSFCGSSRVVDLKAV